jgi:ligand-binding sensor domain-containing protein
MVKVRNHDAGWLAQPPRQQVIETRAGAYWLAAGIAFVVSATDDAAQHSKTTTDPASLFVCYRPHTETFFANVLFEDSAGVIWCGANDGLYRLEGNGNSWQVSATDLKFPNETSDDRYVQALVEDSHRGLWIGTVGSGVYQRHPDGHVNHYTVSQGLPTNRVNALLADKSGQVWVGTTGGLSEIAPESGLNPAPVRRTYTTKDGLAATDLLSLSNFARANVDWLDRWTQRAGGDDRDRNEVQQLHGGKRIESRFSHVAWRGPRRKSVDWDERRRRLEACA